MAILIIILQVTRKVRVILFRVISIRNYYLMHVAFFKFYDKFSKLD